MFCAGGEGRKVSEQEGFGTKSGKDKRSKAGTVPKLLSFVFRDSYEEGKSSQKTVMRMKIEGRQRK